MSNNISYFNLSAVDDLIAGRNTFSVQAKYTSSGSILFLRMHSLASGDFKEEINFPTIRMSSQSTNPDLKSSQYNSIVSGVDRDLSSNQDITKTLNSSSEVGN